jgi:hypothetical protein
MKIIFVLLILMVVMLGSRAKANDVCHCHGYSGPGGPKYDGPGGPAHDGHGGPAYKALEVRVTPVQGGPAIPAPEGMVIVAQRFANSSSFAFRCNVKTDVFVKNSEPIWQVRFATIHVR